MNTHTYKRYILLAVLITTIQSITAMMPLVTLPRHYNKAIHNPIRAHHHTCPLQYQSQFEPKTKTALKILTDGNILAEGEKPRDMINRVVKGITYAELGLPFVKTPSSQFAQKLGSLLDNGSIIFATSILTNAGKYAHRPLSACAMPPVNLLKEDIHAIKKIVDQYHQDGMGTGFNLSNLHNPIRMLTYLNDIAIEGALSENEQRPVGNMALLDIDSPFIEEFIHLKMNADTNNKTWKFNLSVNTTDAFFNAVKESQSFLLKNGKSIDARLLLEKISYAAHQCGCPGIISLDRLNKDNPTPDTGLYHTTAPCAEVGLTSGETCVFGYINLAQLISHYDNCRVDFNKLESSTKILTRALDNALQISIDRYSEPESRTIMEANRKIAIGVCGFADLLLHLDIPYASHEARALLQDILNVISYTSKKESYKLARYRGSFKALESSKYMDESFILDKYGKLETPHVSRLQWEELAYTIKNEKLLRNATTTALPPTGRSGLIINASTGIEPLFSLYNPLDGIHPTLEKSLKNHAFSSNTLQEIEVTGRCPALLKRVSYGFQTATEIHPEEHIAMVVAAQNAIDESVSKTINVPHDFSVENICNLILKAYESGLKGITIYRDGSRNHQPIALTKN